MNLMHLPPAHRSQQGLSLIEILLVVALTSILGVSVVAVGQRFLVNNHLDNKANELVWLLHTARLNSITGKENSQWGVAVSNSEMTSFKGSSYVGRDQAFDITFTVPQSLGISAGEVVFSKVTGEPDTPLSYIITGQGVSHSIELNNLGVVNVN